MRLTFPSDFEPKAKRLLQLCKIKFTKHEVKKKNEQGNKQVQFRFRAKKVQIMKLSAQLWMWSTVVGACKGDKAAMEEGWKNIFAKKKRNGAKP